jgi:nicotinate-nucleotide pyrophosphorylase (carboxylating)
MTTIEHLIELALQEDIGDGDHTSEATIPASVEGKMRLLVKENGIIAGVDIARKVFNKVDPKISMQQLLQDGSQVKQGDIVFYINGPSRSMLIAERTVLNFMQRMSGISTATNKYVKLIEGTKANLLDTRKTTPNMRIFEKMAVVLGGGMNHRMGLYDMVMIKDNHVDFAGGIEKAILAEKAYLKQKGIDLKIEIEVRNFNELAEVMRVGNVNRIMLDNFSPQDLKRAVQIIDGQFETEASGGITLETIREYAETGVDFISVGAITHHIKSLDLSLKSME